MGCASARPEDLLLNEFEKNLPWSKVQIQDYEERVKRLVFIDDSDQITLS